jgi:hypothetical protein
MISQQHIVQFYEDDAFLTESVASFVKVGLQVNDTLIIVATASHRSNLRKVLTRDELDNKNLMFFDAASLLSKIMVDDWPNQSRFMKVLGHRIQKAGRRGRVRVFGEMVAVLWADGKHGAAFHMEELWNSLQATQPLYLFHAYPHSLFTSKEGPESLLAVCQSHTHVRHQKVHTSSFKDCSVITLLVTSLVSLFFVQPSASLWLCVT